MWRSTEVLGELSENCVNLSLFREMRRILLICRRHWRNLLYEVRFLYICCCFNISLHFNFIQDYRQSCRFQDHVLNELTFKCKSIANNLISWLNIIIILKKLVLNIFRKKYKRFIMNLWIIKSLQIKDKSRLKINQIDDITDMHWQLWYLNW